MEFQLFDFNLCDNFLDEIGGELRIRKAWDGLCFKQGLVGWMD